MASNSDKIDDIADGLDDLKTSVEELAEDPPKDAHGETIRKLKDAIEKAIDTSDELEDTQD
jgi:hypothetical protein